MNWRIPSTFVMIGILWGSAWIMTPLLPMPLLLSGAARFAIAAVLLASGVIILRAKGRLVPHPFPLGPSLVLGITLLGLPYALAVWAKGSVSSGLVAVTYAVMPLEAFFFDRSESGTPTLIPAMAIGIGGIAFLAGQGISYSAAQTGGLLLLAAAVGLGAFSLVYAKRHLQRGSLLLSSAIQCVIACILLVFLSGIGGWQRPTAWTHRSLLALTALAAVEGAIALPFLFWLLSQIEAWQAATLQWLAIVVAVAEAGWFLRARPTLQMCAGAVVTVGAIFWLMRSGGGAAGGFENGSDTVTLQITRLIQRSPEASESNEE